MCVVTSFEDKGVSRAGRYHGAVHRRGLWGLGPGAGAGQLGQRTCRRRLCSESFETGGESGKYQTRERPLIRMSTHQVGSRHPLRASRRTAATKYWHGSPLSMIAPHLHIARIPSAEAGKTGLTASLMGPSWAMRYPSLSRPRAVESLSF